MKKLDEMTETEIATLFAKPYNDLLFHEYIYRGIIHTKANIRHNYKQIQIFLTRLEKNKNELSNLILSQHCYITDDSRHRGELYALEIILARLPENMKDQKIISICAKNLIYMPEDCEKDKDFKYGYTKRLHQTIQFINKERDLDY